jgi:hypothetical protein
MDSSQIALEMGQLEIDIAVTMIGNPEVRDGILGNFEAVATETDSGRPICKAYGPTEPEAMARAIELVKTSPRAAYAMDENRLTELQAENDRLRRELAEAKGGTEDGSTPPDPEEESDEDGDGDVPPIVGPAAVSAPKPPAPAPVTVAAPKSVRRAPKADPATRPSPASFTPPSGREADKEFGRDE